MALTYTSATGEIGEATICQVRNTSNSLGEYWHVQAEQGDGTSRTFYRGPDALKAHRAFLKARDWVWCPDEYSSQEKD